MKSQLFYIEPKLDMIVTFLNDIESFRQNKYIITPVTYKQAEYHNKISPFINTIKPYYHKIRCPSLASSVVLVLTSRDRRFSFPHCKILSK